MAIVLNVKSAHGFGSINIAFRIAHRYKRAMLVIVPIIRILSAQKRRHIMQQCASSLRREWRDIMRRTASNTECIASGIVTVIVYAVCTI
jgi:hypothetical protein